MFCLNDSGGSVGLCYLGSVPVGLLFLCLLSSLLKVVICRPVSRNLATLRFPNCALTEFCT